VQPARVYDPLVLAPGTVPAAWFGDEQTEHGSPMMEVADASSGLIVEVDTPPAPALEAAAADEPIDDDLGTSTIGALTERRRMVVVAGVQSRAH
jgi:hypothetical protein